MTLPTGSASVSHTSPAANGRMRLFLTADCNLACFYCHNEGQPKSVSSLMSDEIVNSVEALLKTSEIDKLILSGGEPLLHSGVVEYVARLSPYVRRTSLITNGLLLTSRKVRELAEAGLSKVRLGVDSFDPTKPRPSRGRLNEPFSIEDRVRQTRDAGLDVELNVVLTRFNQSEVPAFLEFATSNALNIKFFEHLQVLPPLSGELINRMEPRPHVAEHWFMSTLEATLGLRPEFAFTDQFAPATSAARIAGTEVRYCRYLCSYQRCWAPGTRIDPEGYVYTCMSNRGRDAIMIGAEAEVLRSAMISAARRGCNARRVNPHTGSASQGDIGRPAASMDLA